jgi:hypothetical protein
MKRSALAVVQLGVVIGLLIATTFVTLSTQTFPLMGIGSLRCYHDLTQHAC